MATLEQIACMADRTEVQDANTVVAVMRSGTIDTWVRVVGERDKYELRASVAI